MAQVTLTEAVRKKIKETVAYAGSNRCDFREVQDMTGTLRRLERYAVTISPQIRVHYVEHQEAPDRVLVHLGIHANANFPLDEQIVEQLTQEFGLGPRAEWQQVLINIPPSPSAHVFKTRSIGTAA